MEAPRAVFKPKRGQEKRVYRLSICLFLCILFPTGLRQRRLCSANEEGNTEVRVLWKHRGSQVEASGARGEVVEFKILILIDHPKCQYF